LEIKKDWPILLGMVAVFLAVKRRRPVPLGHSVKEEFWLPCQKAYDKAVLGAKFVCAFHNPKAVFEALKKDILGGV